jgi:hypothetical protein
MLRPLSFLAGLALLTQTAEAQTVGPMLAGPPSPADQCLAGEYDGHAMEIGGGLRLEADGRFNYGLAYGAIDEAAEGRWESDGSAVYLTSDPVTPPRFVLVSEGPASAPGPANEFHVALDLPNGISRQYFDVLLTLEDGKHMQRQMSEDGLVVPLEAGEKVVAIRIVLPVFELESDRYPVTGSEARVRFEPHDLGKVAFAHEKLALDGGALVLQRYDRAIRFRRGASNGCKR